MTKQISGSWSWQDFGVIRLPIRYDSIINKLIWCVQISGYTFKSLLPFYVLHPQDEVSILPIIILRLMVNQIKSSIFQNLEQNWTDTAAVISMMQFQLLSYHR